MMKIKEISLFEFNNFVSKHPLRSYYETTNYAMLMSECGYDYDLIGFVDNDNKIQAASLILIKSLGSFIKYGYAPKGFLLDYYNEPLFKAFTDSIKSYYYKKNVAFIKVNPEITIATIDNKSKEKKLTNNINIKNSFKTLGYIEMKKFDHFETVLPIYNAVVNLKTFKDSNLSKNVKNKIRKCNRKGLSIESGSIDDLNTFYSFVENKKKGKNNYYKHYYNVFSKDNMADLLLVKVNFEDLILETRDLYEKEQDKNNELTLKLASDKSEAAFNRKVDSDKALLSYKKDIEEATSGLAKSKEAFIAGAIIIKYQNRISIAINGFDQKYRRLNANYFLYYEIIKKYMNDYDFLDLNGISGDFSKENSYYGLNEFKLGFNPIMFQNIGEYDLIINEGLYRKVATNGILAKEFKKD